MTHSFDETQAHQRLQELIGADRYLLKQVIGQGGMATVWLAHDVQQDRDVALKILKPEFSDNHEFLARFRNEAATAKQLASPYVVGTYDYFEQEDPAGVVYCILVLELVQGASLADVLAELHQLAERTALNILLQGALGLAAIHDHGLVHRDIKPGNMLLQAPPGRPVPHLGVLVEDCTVKITDFGIAKAAEAVPLTRTGMVVGTAQYVSPEQAQGLPVTAASDVYSLAVVGYEMLAGRRPFGGDSSVSVAIAHINQPAPQIHGAVSPRAKELIGIAMRKDRNRRYANGAEFAAAIESVLAGRRPPQPRGLSPAAPSATRVAPAAPNRAAGDPGTQLIPAQTGPVQAAPVQIPPTPAAKPATSSTKWWLIGVGAAVVAAAAGVGWLAHGFGDSQSPAPATVAPSTSQVTSAPAQSKQLTNPAPQPAPSKAPVVPSSVVATTSTSVAPTTVDDATAVLLPDESEDQVPQTSTTSADVPATGTGSNIATDGANPSGTPSDAGRVTTGAGTTGGGTGASNQTANPAPTSEAANTDGTAGNNTAGANAAGTQAARAATPNNPGNSGEVTTQ